MPDRRSVRLRHHGYAGGLYFVTICTADRRHLFGGVADGAMRLSPAGRIAHDLWVDTPGHCPAVVPDAFVVMPDHVHLLFGIADGGVGDIDRNRDIGHRRGTACCAPTPTVGDGGVRRFGVIAAGTVPVIVRSYKSAVTRAVRAAHGHAVGAVWQRGYHDRVVRTRREADAVRRYIAQNPARWRGAR